MLLHIQLKPVTINDHESAMLISINENSGDTLHNPIIIIAPSSESGIAGEYAYLEHCYGSRTRNWELLSQSLAYRQSRYYDIFHLQLSSGITQHVYFDITHFYQRSGAEASRFRYR